MFDLRPQAVAFEPVTSSVRCTRLPFSALSPHVMNHFKHSDH